MSQAEKRSPLKAVKVGEPQRHNFPEISIEVIRTGGGLFTVYLNNDVPGLIITGVDFIIQLIGPQDVYAKRYREEGLHCATGYYVDPQFETPTPEDCPGAITRATLLFREEKPSGGGIGVKDQASGLPGYCYRSHAFFLSGSLF